MDNRINEIKKDLIPTLGPIFANYVGNKISRIIKKSSGYDIRYTVLDRPQEPDWFKSHPYYKDVIVVVRKSDNKEFWIYVTAMD